MACDREQGTAGGTQVPLLTLSQKPPAPSWCRGELRDILQRWGPCRVTAAREQRLPASSTKEPWGPCVPHFRVPLVFPAFSSLQDGWAQRYISA